MRPFSIHAVAVMLLAIPASTPTELLVAQPQGAKPDVRTHQSWRQGPVKFHLVLKS